MNSNWKKPEDAGVLCCTIARTSHDELTPIGCKGEKCAHWLWRPCRECSGTGTQEDDFRYVVFCEDTGKYRLPHKEEIPPEDCVFCNGSGHDGSGLGRCGLVGGY